jgi:hypothetical protein
MLDACSPGLWDGPSQCEEALLDGAYPPGRADPIAWLACFCESNPQTCDLVAEYEVFCGRDNCRN